MDALPRAAADGARSGSPPAGATLRVDPGREGTVVHLVGRWTTTESLPAPAAVFTASVSPQTIRFDTTGLHTWDTRLLAWLAALQAACTERGVAIDLDGLPEGVRRLLRLAEAVPPAPPMPVGAHPPWIARVGEAALRTGSGLHGAVAFVGEFAEACGAAVRGRARFRGADLALAVQACGADAFPIVSLISFLSGVILAFVGALQLRPFGAQVYVADLVAIAMVQEMGALMTGIIMAGRSGATFAAQLGAMQANEEIDALITTGVSPLEFLVLPRTLALVAMIPLLALYADLLGVLGGGLIGTFLLRLPPVQYWSETRHALLLSYFALGLIKAVAYGVVIALTACYRGLRSGRSSIAVGEAVTSAVVTSIVLIVCADAALTVIYHVLGF